MTTKRALRRSQAPSVYEAFRELVMLDGARGVEQLAAFMGLRVGTLYNKADSADDSHHQPTVRDLIQVTHFRADHRALDALNEQFGRASFDAAQFEGSSDDALLELLCRLGSEHGEFHAALAKALADKRFTMAELRALRGEAFDVVAALMTLLGRLEGLVDDADHGEPGHG
jgi:hypothetical protein